MKSRKKNKAKSAKSASASDSASFEARLKELFSRPRPALPKVNFTELAKREGKGFAEVVALLGFGKTLKWPGRPKGKQQSETLARIADAAALKFLKYSQRQMVPLLFPKQPDMEEGRKTVQKFLKRNKAQIAAAVKNITRERAEQVKQSLPRDKN